MVFQGGGDRRGYGNIYKIPRGPDLKDEDWYSLKLKNAISILLDLYGWTIGLYCKSKSRANRRQEGITRFGPGVCCIYSDV